MAICINCGGNNVEIIKGLCRKCYRHNYYKTKERKEKEGTCVKCNEYRIIKGNGLCNRCYNNWYYHNKEDKERRLVTQQLWRDRNPDKCKEYSLKYYNKNPALMKERSIICGANNRKRNIEYLKTIMVVECEVCKYNKCFAALEMHHEDKEQKLNSRDHFSYWLKYPLKRFKAKIESTKYKLLCANCHRELHWSNIR